MEKSVIEIMDILSNKIDEYISLNFFNEDKIAANVKFFKKKI
jgi:translation initiation factor 2B subunit (eIF-2B alpha/beta/delta family)